MPRTKRIIGVALAATTVLAGLQSGGSGSASAAVPGAGVIHNHRVRPTTTTLAPALVTTAVASTTTTIRATTTVAPATTVRATTTTLAPTTTTGATTTVARTTTAPTTPASSTTLPVTTTVTPTTVVATTVTPTTVVPTTTTVVPTTTTVVKAGPLLIEHGWDTSSAASTAANAARIDALPFDGISINPTNNPCSARPVTLAAAQADLGAMPRLTKVTHNFLLCRLLDNAVAGSTVGPYDVNNDATWATMASNLAIYAQVAKASGMFDGIIFDTEYYGVGPNPWDADTIAIPWTYSFSRPWTLPAALRAKAQSRGKQTLDAVRAVWPNVVAFHLRGAELSDPATYVAGNVGGNDVAWANEMAGPFFVGAIESATGTAATVVDGGESYRQRTAIDFQNNYSWLKTRLANSNGPIVPSGAVTSASYNATVSVASQVYDRDITRSGYPFFTAAQVQTLLTYAKRSTDKYQWFYTEAYDWRGTGWPATSPPAAYIDSVRLAR